MRFALFGAVCAAALALGGCPNPNQIGVQQFGTITATVLLASNNQPVANALVAVNTGPGGQCKTGADGTCTLNQVPVGPQSVTANATGLQGPPVAVNVAQQNQNYPVTILMYPSS
ncbi:MAG: carboxypeptidase regulatory-like domain-containing protein [Candidatus Eremiobacteraeota bacterium]|nr:carboxypeptidase regulatory-like domain-containing protein [Candidatus Eremiobacteraeota bacterium]MBV8366056.1 carboxypeptidase regulatory-like domain-containing protein [Candidatus Eremiobacteraeota bacterium]